MRRVNTFEVVPRSDADAECLRQVLDASASLWNQINYERRQNFTDYDTDKSVWDTEDYRKQYVGVLGSATAQQVIRKNDQAWRSFFALKESGEANGLPGYWGNEDDGRDLRSYIRNDMYRIRWATGNSKQSILEISVGKDLKDEFDIGHRERLRLEVRGEPKWTGDQCQLELFYDERSGQFRAIQPVKDCSRQDTPLADETAALDVGVNNLVACSTSTGQQFLYEGRDLFARFRETTERIAEYQALAKADEGRYSTRRIRRLYRKRTQRRDHAQDALCRDLIERLHDEGVATVCVGDLTDVLETSWSVRTNAKTHNFWAFRKFINRLACTAEEFGMTVEVRSEAWTSQECPDCGGCDETVRHSDTLTCPCGFEGHADLAASSTFLDRQLNEEVGAMARPVRLKWNAHRWAESPHSRSNEVRTHQQKTFVGG